MATVEQIKAAAIEAEPVIDAATFNSVKAIPDLMGEVEKVVNERLNAMQQIRAQPQLSMEMVSAFGDQAHGLKSGISMIGCKKLALLCYKLEIFAKPGPHMDTNMLFGLYDHYMGPVLTETMQHLQAALAQG